MTDRSDRIAEATEAIRELIADWPGVTLPRATAHVLAKAAIDALNLKERDAENYANGYADAVRYQAHLAGRRS